MPKSEERSGVLEVNPKGFGFLRDPDSDFHPGNGDPYLSRDLIKKLRLKEGQFIVAQAAPAKRGKVGVKRVESVNGLDPKEVQGLKPFRKLTSISPDRRIRLEHEGGPEAMRVVDMVAPIGFGTRGLIVAAPKTGKTTLLKQMAAAVSANYPETEILALLVDERPEEVTDFRRSIKGRVIASSLDQDSGRHRQVANLVSAAARRMVEAGRDVFLILDSITRVARAFNAGPDASGRTMSGGLDARAMETPRRIFGSARATEEAGTLTIIATALVDTGSRMDELIFHEFKGTGNMELVLDRKMAEGRIWPAVNLAESGTRREELLQGADENTAVSKLRRALLNLPPLQATERLIQAVGEHPDNEALFRTVIKAA